MAKLFTCERDGFGTRAETDGELAAQVERHHASPAEAMQAPPEEGFAMAVPTLRPRRLAMVVAALGLFVAGLLPAPAFANAGGSASCVGLELSDISPPGTNPEFPDGGPGFVAEVTELATALGFKNRGDLISFIAKLHEGSHEGCDEALGLG